jgi:hypothetical protein
MTVREWERPQTDCVNSRRGLTHNRPESIGGLT